MRRIIPPAQVSFGPFPFERDAKEFLSRLDTVIRYYYNDSETFDEFKITHHADGWRVEFHNPNLIRWEE